MSLYGPGHPEGIAVSRDSESQSWRRLGGGWFVYALGCGASCFTVFILI